MKVRATIAESVFYVQVIDVLIAEKDFCLYENKNLSPLILKEIKKFLTFLKIFDIILLES